MDARKLQKVGYSTLSVSLPSSWVKKNSLKRGDNVFLMPEKDGSLKLFPSELVKSREEVEEYICNADLCDDPKMLERVIVGSYILGREVFSIISSERMRSEHIQEIRGIMHKLIGLGIVEETPDRITLQCSVDPRKFHVDMLLRRLSIISLTIVKEAIQALVDSDESLARDAISREDEADMMHLLAMRLLISAQRRREVAEEIGLIDPLHILYFGLMLKYLELIADYAEEIARRVIELLQKYKDRLPKWVIERLSNLNDLAHDLVLKSVDAFFIGDIKIANSLLEILTFIELERDKLIREIPELPHLRSILWDINRIADNGAGIALIAINNTLEKKTKICSKRWSISSK
ncbi:MAG: phosphate uptake regulator PhoU [Candidatus Bathyarchaeota archaeon]|nr:phosphate uptake regulator PhoU [Candidatus Bathyarchaeota archaeon]MDH5494984.1 phosphate uptake regulator PhoU [Candidatus Bathyarchaeota archaeon]